jgi:hypothetical protein
MLPALADAPSPVVLCRVVQFSSGHVRKAPPVERALRYVLASAGQCTRPVSSPASDVRWASVLACRLLEPLLHQVVRVSVLAAHPAVRVSATFLADKKKAR